MTLSDKRKLMMDTDDEADFGYWENDLKQFIKECEDNSKYSEGIKGNAMSIPIWRLKELAGEKLI